MPDFLWPFVWGALFDLVDDEQWEEHGNLTPEETAALFYDFYYNPKGMLGAIIPLVGTLPDYMLLCDGTTYQRVDYPTLYDALDPALIVDANTFKVPDLRGKFLLGDGNGRVIADTGGAETHTLTESEMPVHSHGYESAVPSLTTIVVPDEPSAVPAPATTAPAGGNQPHNNMPPYYVLKYAIFAK